jgi:hypothetical protein
MFTSPSASRLPSTVSAYAVPPSDIAKFLTPKLSLTTDSFKPSASTKSKLVIVGVVIVTS